MTVALGSHFALSDADLARVKALSGTDELVEFVGNEIEGAYAKEWTVDTDKAWEGIHRAFSGGSFFYEFETPLHGVILGGEPLTPDDVHVVVLKTAEEVRTISAAIGGLDEACFRAAYLRMDPSLYETVLSEDDCEYCWNSVVDLKPFYERSAAVGRAVIFTAY